MDKASFVVELDLNALIITKNEQGRAVLMSAIRKIPDSLKDKIKEMLIEHFKEECSEVITKKLEEGSTMADAFTALLLSAFIDKK